MKSLGTKISELRKKHKLTQDELAEKMGVSAQAVSKWENDLSIPDITILIELSNYFHVSLDALLKEEEVTTAFLPEEERKPIEQMFLKIRVLSVDGDKVRINIPLAFIKMAVDAGIEIPSITQNEHLKGIDLTTIVAMVETGAIGKLVEVESAEGDIVEIMVE